MIIHAKQGQTSYGEAIGILLLDTFTPFIQGDVGNAATFPYPVRYQRVEGFTVARALGKAGSVLEPLIEAAVSLEREGVRAITGDCGYMILHQQEVARRVSVPVFLSSLLQLPFILSILPPEKKAGVLCASSESLDAAPLSAAGIHDSGRLAIHGMQDYPAFNDTFIRETGTLDTEKVRREMADAARSLIADHPDTGAILLECSCLPPYAAAVHDATGLPVFDYITMINHVHNAVVPNRYEDRL